MSFAVAIQIISLNNFPGTQTEYKKSSLRSLICSYCWEATEQLLEGKSESDPPTLTYIDIELHSYVLCYFQCVIEPPIIIDHLLIQLINSILLMPITMSNDKLSKKTAIHCKCQVLSMYLHNNRLSFRPLDLYLSYD